MISKLQPSELIACIRSAVTENIYELDIDEMAEAAYWIAAAIAPLCAGQPHPDDVLDLIEVSHAAMHAEEDVESPLLLDGPRRDFIEQMLDSYQDQERDLATTVLNGRK